MEHGSGTGRASGGNAARHNVGMRSATLFDVLVVAHVLSAVAGFGALAVGGMYAALARPDAVARFYAKGPNRASRLIFAVPAFGVAAAWAGGGHDFSQPWLWAGSALWLAACGAATGLVWPAESRLGSFFSATEPVPAQAPRGHLRRAAWGAALADLCFLAALVLMVARPGGS